MVLSPASWVWYYLQPCGYGLISSLVGVVISPALWVWSYLQPCGCGYISSLVGVVLSPTLWVWLYLQPCRCGLIVSMVLSPALWVSSLMGYRVWSISSAFAAVLWVCFGLWHLGFGLAAVLHVRMMCINNYVRSNVWLELGHLHLPHVQSLVNANPHWGLHHHAHQHDFNNK